MKKWVLLVAGLYLFTACSYYHEATKKKEVDRDKDTILSLLALKKNYDDLMDFQEKMDILTLFQNGGGLNLPDACKSPDNDPNWTIPAECTTYLPSTCKSSKTWGELQQCAGSNLSGGLNVPTNCQAPDGDRSWVVPDSCKSYLPEQCRTKTTWGEVQDCVSQVAGLDSLPDTSNDPNPINNYPGSAPATGSYTKGTCFFDTDKAVTGTRDWCCYNVTSSECKAAYDYLNPSGNTNYIPTFQEDAASTQQSCFDQSFVYCDSGIKCCYN